MTETKGDGKFHFAIDRGGTFTDVHCILPDGKEVVSKLLSEDPAHYKDAPTEGIRRILATYDGSPDHRYERHQPVRTHKIGSIRMGTTVATNALLERNGAPMALLTTSGLQDMLEIGNQSRPNIFDLTCARPSLLYRRVVGVTERIMLSHFAPPAYKTCYEEKTGITGEKVLIVQTPDKEEIRRQLEELRDAGITAIAVCFLHAYVYGEHERIVGDVAKEMNCFEQISLSHQIMPMVKAVSRGHTTTAAAYLTPKITTYLQSFQAGFDGNLKNVPLTFMKSDGGLAPVNDFGGHQAILSGPAGGVVGYAKTTTTATTASESRKESQKQPLAVIGFDMGGTSTDVSRYAGHWEHVLETVTAGVAIQAPQLDIQTVAAGGGSLLQWRNGLLHVGPESAGAHPGPVCYRKEGGKLAVTDANAVLGRIMPQYFPHIFGPNEDEPLDVDGSKQAFANMLRDQVGATIEQQSSSQQPISSVEDLAYGFWQVANEAMCRPIRNLTQMKGYDLTTHTLACFGGAGPQHACAMALALGMKRVFVHRYSGILSAFGLSMADAVNEEQEPAHEVFDKTTKKLPKTGEKRLTHLAEKAKQALVKQGYSESSIVVERYVNMRFDGTDHAIMVPESVDQSFDDTFCNTYQREFGFVLTDKDIILDDYRVRAVVPGRSPPMQERPQPLGKPEAHATTKAFFGDLTATENTHKAKWLDVPVYKMEDLQPGHEIPGPCIIVQPTSTVILEMHCTAFVTANGDFDIAIGKTDHHGTEEVAVESVQRDPVQLSIFAHRFMGIAEQMGRTLQRTAISVNMKERLDFSCALFTANGGLVANAPHIPVHLGAMERAVQFQIEYWNSENRGGIQEGDVLVSNHPQLAGGSHLPDITVITPVFVNDQVIFFVASRGHHADIGGIAPGSMPPHSKCLDEEGATIVGFKLVQNGEFQEKGITEILMSPSKIPGSSGTRNLSDNLSDLRAQVAANQAGIRLLQELVEERGLSVVQAYMEFIQKNAEEQVRDMLKTFAKTKTKLARAADMMDDGSPIQLAIEIDPETGSAKFDFSGTGPQVLGNHNAPPAVTFSAVIYSLRCLVAQDIPLNQGCLAPVEFVIPENSLLNPSADAGVVGGNVLTSQRVVDVVLKAFQACAASQGCMNNLTFGDNKFGYYETIAGGAGAGPQWDGTSGIHTHCTNTRITDPEILERRYPVVLRQFSLRHGSGGGGKHKGGDGIVRELVPLRPLVMSILSERRVLRPYGMAGGEDGAAGRNFLIRPKERETAKNRKHNLLLRGDEMNVDGVDSSEKVINLGGRCSVTVEVGDRLRIETPGGGGYGTPVPS